MTGQDEAVVTAQLTEAVRGLEIGPAPYERIVRGGRRRLLRRRVTTVGAAVVAVACVAVLGSADATTRRSLPVAPAHSTSPSVGPSPKAPGPDPLTPVRSLVAQGTTSGRTWQAWAEFWPAAPTFELGKQQARLLADERGLPMDPDEQLRSRWSPYADVIHPYLLVDGQKVNGSEFEVPTTHGGMRGAEVEMAGGEVIGMKTAGLADSPVLVQGVRPDVAKVVVTWQDGSTTEAVPAQVGGSLAHWYAVRLPSGLHAESIDYYSAEGGLLFAQTKFVP